MNKKTPSKPVKKWEYMFMLSLFSLGVFGMFSDSDINLFVKVSGLLICLQGGIALTNYTICKIRRKKYDST